jgi:hypothetical protein
MIHVALVNESTVLQQADFLNIAKALQTQVHNDFLPAWGVDATITPVAKNQIPASSWVLAFLDNADQAGALGYHDITPRGLPLGKAFVKTTLADGGQISVTASHELLEMLGDPDINLTAEVDDASGAPAKFYAYEVCDACEDDPLGYQIGGVQVSDFVYPAFFESFRKPKSAQFDHMKHITAPLQILPGGYLGVLDLGNLSAGWQQITQDKRGSVRRPRVGSRRERRRTSRQFWNLSDFKVVDKSEGKGA